MMARICDKCKKTVISDTKYWDSSNEYVYQEKPQIKIGDQILEMKVRLTLACGDHLDLCNSCANKFIKTKVGR
jgi:hypothetical protein